MNLLFVYGSLRRGEDNHHRLGPARFAGAATIRGALYDCGAFRALVKDARSRSRIAGELHELRGDVAAKLAELDRFEAEWKFRRARVRVTLRGGRQRWAWTYFFAGRLARGARQVPIPGTPRTRGPGHPSRSERGGRAGRARGTAAPRME